MLLLHSLKISRIFAASDDKENTLLLTVPHGTQKTQGKRLKNWHKSMKKLNVTESNFQEIREALKMREVIRVNDKITLVSFIANTETVNATTGKKTRTPFYYVAENGAKYSSTTLKEKLGLTPETKGERKETTFAKVWEQAKGLAQKASSEELQEAIKHLQSIIDAREEEERVKAEKERKRQEALSKLSAEERELLGL